MRAAIGAAACSASRIPLCAKRCVSAIPFSIEARAKLLCSATASWIERTSCQRAPGRQRLRHGRLGGAGEMLGCVLHAARQDLAGSHHRRDVALVEFRELLGCLHGALLSAAGRHAQPFVCGLAPPGQSFCCSAAWAWRGGRLWASDHERHLTRETYHPLVSAGAIMLDRRRITPLQSRRAQRGDTVYGRSVAPSKSRPIDPSRRRFERRRGAARLQRGAGADRLLPLQLHHRGQRHRAR